MCWSTVSNLSFRKFAVFASRFSWVFSPDICYRSKSEVPEEHLQVLLLPKNFKVELDHWHLTANVSVFYTFLKFWHIKMSGSTDEIYSFYRSITLEHVLKCSSPLYLCGILRSLEDWCFSPCFSICILLSRKWRKAKVQMWCRRQLKKPVPWQTLWNELIMRWYCRIP